MITVVLIKKRVSRPGSPGDSTNGIIASYCKSFTVY